MAENSVSATKFYLTSRACEQLDVASAAKPAVRSEVPSINNYISTTPQNAGIDKNENAAIRSFAIANFSLENNSAVNSFNKYIRNSRI